MFGKIIGAVAGAKAADHIGSLNQPGGALLGIGAAALVRRMGVVGLLAALAGGYVFKRYADRHDRARPTTGKRRSGAARKRKPAAQPG